MGKFKDVIRPTVGHEGVMDLRRGNDSPHGDRAIRQLLGDIQNIGHDTKGVGPCHCTAATKAGDDLVKNEQHVMLIAKRPQPLQITHRWR